MKSLRNEINTRTKFAKKQGEYWFRQIRNIAETGNVLTCRASKKYRQACAINDHYNKEFINYINGK